MMLIDVIGPDIWDSKPGHPETSYRRRPTKMATQGLDAPEIPPTVTLRSKDGHLFSVERKSVVISSMVKNVMEGDPTALEVKVHNVNASILKLVVEYINHHKGTEADMPQKPLRSKHMKDVCSDPWDAELLDRIAPNRQQLYDLILVGSGLPVTADG
jgi:hypothetical protein